MDAQRLSLLVNHLLRAGYICKLQDVCNQALAVRTNDHVALLWRAAGLLLESRTAEVNNRKQYIAQQTGLDVLDVWLP